jgi:Concanavalin A-like lectin/glucanases superfamily
MPIPNSLAAGSARAFGFLGSISPSDPYFNYVTMLLPGNGTNGAQNNTFRDSSTNNLTITRNGNTTQGTFSPYGNNWSNFFDGTGDYLQAATSTAFDFGTGDFTIEFWVNFAALSSNRMLIDRWSSGDSNSWQIYWRTTGSSIAYLVGGTIVLQDPSATNIVVNAWNHVAVTRSGSTNRLFINGALVATATNSTSLTNALPLAIGVQRETLTNYFNGYISNVRILKGTALYTAAFTPPTAPLTAITNTSLLTCQSNRFIDNSTNNFTITRNGDVSVQRFSPFNPTASYAPSIDGGSGYFDGTGDSLVSASSASNILSTNDFTIEFWLYPSNTSVAYRALVSSENYSAITGGWSLYQNGAALELWVSPNSSAVITASAALTAGAWQHIALSRVSGTLRLFVNGTQAGSLGTGAAFTGQQVWIGDNNAPSFDYFVIGYMSDVRIVNGTGLYTTAFTPPTAPLTAVTNTSFLANFTNAGIIDNADMNNLETVGNAQISTAQSKFGSGSIFLDGTGDGVYAPSSQNFALPGDFTIEFWLYQTATSGEGTAVYNPTTNGFNVFMSISGNWGIARSNVAIDNNFGTTPSFNTWNHIAISRSTGTIRAFVNGNQVFSGTNTTSYVAGPLQIGISGFGSITGYIDDLRITKGYARYTANFTPPAAAFPTK